MRLSIGDSNVSQPFCAFSFATFCLSCPSLELKYISVDVDIVFVTAKLWNKLWHRTKHFWILSLLPYHKKQIFFFFIFSYLENVYTQKYYTMMHNFISNGKLFTFNWSHHLNPIKAPQCLIIFFSFSLVRNIQSLIQAQHSHFSFLWCYD